MAGLTNAIGRLRRRLDGGRVAAIQRLLLAASVVLGLRWVVGH